MVLAILSGILTALAFPKPGLSFLAWVSLIPLFDVLAKKKGESAFRLGALAGLGFYGVLLYWIPAVPAHYGGMPYWLCLLIYFALISFLALYWGLFAALFTRILRAFPVAAFLVAPLIWISCEYLETHLFTGFPWGLLGTSQYRDLPFLQMASWAGVYGISVVLVFLQSTFVLAMRYRIRSPFFTALALLALVHAWGGFTLRKANFIGTAPIKTSVIQGNVPSDVYWDVVSPELIRKLFDEHMALTRLVVNGGAGLVIWPEFTVPLCFSCEEDWYKAARAELESFVRTSGATLLLGTNETTGPPEKRQFHNTAIALHPDLSRTRYFKMHLVPFGEYTPLKRVFFFIEKLTHAIGDITPGTEPVLHEYAGFRFGTPICYEIIFPRLVRGFVRRGADFLVTITNDGWYGTSSAPYQHWAQAVLRAVENRRYLLRAATTGISGVIDPYGRILAQSRLMTQTAITEDIFPSRRPSFYSRAGDIVPLAGLTLTGAFFILALFLNWKGRENHGRNRHNI